MSAELLFCAGVEVEDIFCGAFNPINFHQLVTDILSTHKTHTGKYTVYQKGKNQRDASDIFGENELYIYQIQAFIELYLLPKG